MISNCVCNDDDSVNYCDLMIKIISLYKATYITLNLRKIFARTILMKPILVKMENWKNGKQSLRKKCPSRSYSGPHFSHIFPHSDWIWRDTEYISVFSPNAEKCEKNADQNNSEYGLFLRSEHWCSKTYSKNWLEQK